MVSRGQLQSADSVVWKAARKAESQDGLQGESDDLWKVKGSGEPGRPWGWPVPWPLPRRCGPECPGGAGRCLSG